VVTVAVTGIITDSPAVKSTGRFAGSKENIAAWGPIIVMSLLSRCMIPPPLFETVIFLGAEGTFCITKPKFMEVGLQLKIGSDGASLIVTSSKLIYQGLILIQPLIPR